jgi:hypothetical protein
MKHLETQKEAVNKAKASLDEVNATLVDAAKQEADSEKKHADTEAGFINVCCFQRHHMARVQVPYPRGGVGQQ